MGEFDKAAMRRGGRPFPGMIPVLGALFAALLLVGGAVQPPACAAAGESVAVLPFQVHTPGPEEKLARGLQTMLGMDLKKRGLKVVEPQRVNAHPRAFTAGMATEELGRLGRDLGVAWVISGSVTQIGRTLSLDLKLVDVTGRKTPFMDYMTAKDMDELPEAVGRIAAAVDFQISGVPQVDSVQVTGNQRVEKAAIVGMVKTRKGDRLDYDQLDQDLRDIYKMGFFDNVTIETEEGPKGEVVIFRVEEKPSIGKIIFEGNEEVDDDDLKKELGIRLYSILDNAKVNESVERLKEFYRQKGYYNARIEPHIESLPENQVLLKYAIHEDEKVYIEEIRFVGNKAFDDDDLKDIMETSEKGFFSWMSWLTKWGYLDKKKLEFDVHKLTAYYHNHGYIKAKVGEPEITYEKGKGIIVTIDIQEGPQYDVGTVNVKGDLIEPPEELLIFTQIGTQKVFSRETVRRDILRLRDVYANEGFAYADVVPLIQEDDETHLVDITYDIQKGKKVRFERVNITGNTVTRDKVIRRELWAIEGGYFSGQALKRSEQNLHRLGFFEQVEMKTRKGSAEDLMILDVNVKERPTGSFSVGAGYSSQDSAFVMFQVAQNNLFGYGQKLQASAKLGGTNTEFDIKFVEPWLMGTRISLGLDAYKWKQEYTDYTRSSLGGAVAFGFPMDVIDDFTRLTLTYNYDDADISDLPEDASPEFKEMEGRNVTSSLILELKRDSRDKPWNTTTGSINSFTFQYAGGILGGDLGFNKYRLRTAWFFPFWWETVFMVQGRWGYVTKHADGKLPIYQKFFLGGIDTVRGFEYDDISPKDENGYRIGGEKMMCYNFEYRFPLLKEQGLVGLVFFDAGNVFTKDQSWSFSGIRKSVGGGVRWYSPMGPLRLEYGRNLDPQGDERQGAWEFSVGGLF